jgi:hypothetical protein
MRTTPGARFWQRNYYERIIRNEKELERIHQYIIDNPELWTEDEYYRQFGLDQAPAHQLLGDLQRVERGALTQVVADNPVDQASGM